MSFTPIQSPPHPHSHVAPHSDLATHQGQDVICIHNLSFAYDHRLALSNITLHVKSNSTLGVIGPNGGGKSTLLKLMLGALKPDAGTISVLDRSPRAACADGSLVGYVPQRHNLDWTFPISVRQVVTLGLIGRKPLFGAFSRQQKDLVRQTLLSVEMDHLADQPIGDLSGGQQQRVFIARALVNRPRILFLDEPTAGIDQAGQEKFLALLATLKSQFHLTLVMVSHDLRSILASADRVACLNRTLHYHDRPQGLSSDVLFKVFQCDLDAVLDQHSTTHDPTCCAHDHPNQPCTHPHNPLAPPPKNPNSS